MGATIPISNASTSIPPTSTSIKAVGSNELILTGYFSGSTDLNSCANTAQLAASSTDGFITKYSGESWPSTIGQVSGPTLACSSNTTFTIPGLAPGLNIIWTSSSNLTYVSGQGTADYTVKAASGAQGEGWVQAEVSGPCGTGSVIRYKPIDWVGATPTVTYDGKIGSCYEPELVYRAPIITGAVYNWSINTNKLALSFSGFTCNVANVSVADGSSQSFYLTVSITQGGCTVTKTVRGLYSKPTICDCGYNDPSCGGSGGPPSPLSVHPVPANDQITISVASDQNSNDEVIKSVDVYNSQQVIVISQTKLNKKEVVLDVSNLASGLYYFHITTQKGTETRQVLIE